MSGPNVAIAEEAKNLTFNTSSAYDDPLTLRRKDPSDPNSPWLIRVALDQSTIIGSQEGIKDLKSLHPNMRQQIKWALQEIETHSRLKGHIEFQFVNTPDADISFLQAAPVAENSWGGRTGGWMDTRGQVHKEVLFNPNDIVWNHSDAHKKRTIRSTLPILMDVRPES